MGISTTDTSKALSTNEKPTPEAQPMREIILPEEPLITIEADKRGLPFNLSELWHFRELFYFLTQRDIKVRYKQTILGISWVVIQPLSMTVIFTLFLGVVAKVPRGALPYPLLIYTALLPWNLFSSGVSTAANSLIGNSNLLTKVYFPRVLLPASSVAARLLDFGISFVILIGLFGYYRVVRDFRPPLSWNLAALPFLILLTVLMAFGFGLLVSALNVKRRDLGAALPVALQVWMFVSPILYPLNFVPEKWHHLYALNPLVGVIEGFRYSLLGGRLNWFALAVSVVFTIVLLVLSGLIFHRFEDDFADFV